MSDNKAQIILHKLLNIIGCHTKKNNYSVNNVNYTTNSNKAYKNISNYADSVDDTDEYSSTDDDSYYDELDRDLSLS